MQVKLSFPKYIEVFFGALYGLIFAGVLISSKDWEVSFFLKVIIFMVILFVPLFIMKVLGRWTLCEKN